MNSSLRKLSNGVQSAIRMLRNDPKKSEASDVQACGWQTPTAELRPRSPEPVEGQQLRHEVQFQARLHKVGLDLRSEQKR
jgi:hypothetical protein